jgi:hypothetical protein
VRRLRDVRQFADRRLDEIGYAGGWVAFCVTAVALTLWVTA